MKIVAIFRKRFSTVNYNSHFFRCVLPLCLHRVLHAVFVPHTKARPTHHRRQEVYDLDPRPTYGSDRHDGVLRFAEVPWGQGYHWHTGFFSYTISRGPQQGKYF